MTFTTARGEERIEITDELLTGSVAFFSGINSAGSSPYIYGGFIASPWSHIHDNGIRLKIEGGLGQYKYDSDQVSGAKPNVFFSGKLHAADLLLGYYYRSGDFATTLWLGGAYNRHEVFPYDAANAVKGAKLGLKSSIDVWKGLGDSGWVSLNGSYSTAFEDYWAEARAAVRVLPRLSLGLEGAEYGNINYSANRIGGFLKIESSIADITLSGGYGGNHNEEKEPYVSLNIYRNF